MSERKDEGTRELTILVGVLLAAVVGVGATIWVSADPTATELETSAVTVADSAPPGASGAGEVRPVDRPVYHADVYFDFKSTRLRADAVRVLQEHAALVEAGSVWGVLIQGHADLHGPAEYNRALAQRRAEVVMRFLVELGVPETSIRVVTIGQDGALCDDATPECQQLNRRVHIEIRKLPGVAGVPVRAPVISGDMVAPAASLAASRDSGVTSSVPGTAAQTGPWYPGIESPASDR